MSYEDMARDAGCTTEEEVQQMAQMIEEDHRRQMMEEQEQEQEQDISRERELLREEQTETVMPMIGSLLDRWEDLPNDVKSDPELSALKKAIENILTAMEGGHE